MICTNKIGHTTTQKYGNIKPRKDYSERFNEPTSLWIQLQHWDGGCEI